jgi:hypothetical protein
MKRKKLLMMLVVMVFAFSVAAIAPAQNGKPFQRLQNEINDNLMRINELEWEVTTLQSLIEGLQDQIDDLQEQIDEIMALLEPEPGEPTLAGTWINEEYSTSEYFSGKVIFIDNGDGTFTEELYKEHTDTEPHFIATAHVVHQELDSNGNLIIKFWADIFDTTAYTYNMIHADNMTIESNWTETGVYPTEIDDTLFEYNIFYRPE